MNKEQFIKYATDFSSLDKQSLEELKLLIEEFPHFQTAWVLYAKNLHSIKDVRFESNLKLAATHTGDRKLLKNIIEDKYYLPKSQEIKQEIVETGINEEQKDKTLITEATYNQVEDTPEYNQEKENVTEVDKYEPKELKIEPRVEEKHEKPLENSDNIEQENKEDEPKIDTDNQKTESIADLILKNVSEIQNEQKNQDIKQEEIPDNKIELDQSQEKFEPEVNSELSTNQEETEEEIVSEVQSEDSPIETVTNVSSIVNEPVTENKQHITEEPSTSTMEEESVIENQSILEEKENNSTFAPGISEEPQKPLTKPGSSAADKILENINNIKTGNISEENSENDFSNKSDLEQIIAARLKELGINQEPIEQEEQKEEPTTKTVETERNIEPKVSKISEQEESFVEFVQEKTIVEEETSPEETQDLPQSEESVSDLVLKNLFGKRKLPDESKDFHELTKKENPSDKEINISDSDENLEQESEVFDINQFTNAKNEQKTEKEYAKPDLKSDDFISFEFENTVEEKKSEKKSELNLDKKTALIDKFLSSDPRIVPQKDYSSNGSFATDSVLYENEELFSETLAKIYIKQEHYEKAILTYEKLCLKYPEKNIYFAGQIEKIKELIKNKKE